METIIIVLFVIMGLSNLFLWIGLNGITKVISSLLFIDKEDGE